MKPCQLCGSDDARLRTNGLGWICNACIHAIHVFALAVAKGQKEVPVVESQACCSAPWQVHPEGCDKEPA